MIDTLGNWIREHQSLVWILGIASIVVFIGSLILIPIVVSRVPADYFAHDTRPRGRWADQHPFVRLALRIGKNILGYVFVIAGVAMLVLPGQGLLSILIGVLMLDLPGKYRFERWLIARRWVHRPINALRRRRGHAPLRVQ